MGQSLRQGRPSPVKPVVMVFAGNDPSGGAGLAADTEALAAHGCHVCPVVTALTVQDTQGVRGFEPVAPSWVARQARAVLADMPVAVFKLGMLAGSAVAAAGAEVLRQYPAIPVVYDPVMRGGGGGSLALGDGEGGQTMLEVVRQRLLPRTTIATPNRGEARLLSGAGADADACGRDLVRRGCRYVLVTGADEGSGDVVHRLYGTTGGATRGAARGAAKGETAEPLRQWAWPRLPGVYHGSGCTLAAAIAGRLARGEPPLEAMAAAQDYTWHALRHGLRLGRGQFLPERFYWTDPV